MNEETTTSLIDTALASGSATALDPEERKLQELVLAIRDDAPTPDPDFALRMNARVAAGFPRKRGSGVAGRIGTLFSARPQMAWMGAAAMLLVGLVVALSVIGSNGSSPSSNDIANAPVPADAGAGSASSAAGGSSAGGSTAAQSAPSREAGSDQAPSLSSAPAAKAAPGSLQSGDTVGVPPIAPSPPSSGFVGGRSRKVERSAALVLAPAKDKLSQVGDQVIAVTDRYRGFVLRSSVTSAADQGSSGNFDLRIPVRNLQPALHDLSELADVKSRTENADDVTATFVSARTRLEELQAERRGLLRRLEKATTDQQAAAIRARIRLVNAQIESQMSVMNELKRRTSYASVSVTLEPKAKDSGGGGGISDGARDLRDSLVDAANLALRVLGVALPIAILIALLWAGGGWFSRRRRESVLN